MESLFTIKSLIEVGLPGVLIYITLYLTRVTIPAMLKAHEIVVKTITDKAEVDRDTFGSSLVSQRTAYLSHMDKMEAIFREETQKQRESAERMMETIVEVKCGYIKEQ